MTRKLLLGLTTIALVATLSLSLSAQNVKTKGTNDAAKSITISGEVDFTWLARSEPLSEILDNAGQRALPSTNNETMADNLLLGYFLIRFDAELADKVNAVVELETLRFVNHEDGFDVGMGTAHNGGALVGRTNVAGFDANVDNQIDVIFGQVYINVDEFLWPQLSARLGIQDLKYDLRGNGNEFFMDLRGSEKAFFRPLAESFAGNIYFGDGYTVADVTGASLDRGLVRGLNNTAGGLKLTWKHSDELLFDVFFMTVLETSAIRLDGRWDESVFGINVDYNVAENSLLNLIYAAIRGSSGRNMIHTFGVGLDYGGFENWELYGELYYQTGTYSFINDTGAVPAERRDLDQKAWAYYFGAKYTFADVTGKPWVDFSYTFVSGDDGDISNLDAAGNRNDPDENEDFVSYEDNDATLILEDNIVGFDIDSNYSKFQLELGTHFTLDKEDDLTLSTVIALAQLDENPDRAGLAGTNSTDLELDDDLGTEWDVKAAWTYNENLTFMLGLGILFGPDFFERDNSNPRDGFILRGTPWVFLLDTRVTF